MDLSDTKSILVFPMQMMLVIEPFFLHVFLKNERYERRKFKANFSCGFAFDMGEFHLSARHLNLAFTFFISSWVSPK